MVKRSIWDWLAWIVLAGILVWIVLKMFGVINTPVLLEYAPYLGAVYLAGWYAQKIEMMSGKLNLISYEFRKFRGDTIKEVHNIKINCAKNHG